MLPHYSGNPVGVNGEGLSCDQFCTIVENQIDTFKWSSEEAFAHAIGALTGPAMAWSYDMHHEINAWADLKLAMMVKFRSGSISIQLKAELRKSLKQNEGESSQDFYSRCADAEKLICDEKIDEPCFERDVLLTFLIGLREDLQMKVMQSQGSSLNDFLQAAIKVETNSFSAVKTEDLQFSEESDLEEENDFSSVKKEDLDSDNDLMQCTDCELSFKSEKQYKSHLKSQHHASDSKLKCSKCSATFKTSRMLRLHIGKNHCENSSRYSCQTCQQDFYDLKKFVLHQIKFHAERNGDEIYCLACQRPYTKSHSLQVHMIRKHYKEKPFPCDRCDKKFFTVTDAQKHIKIVHLNEKPFACEKCGKQYSTSGGLLIHNRSAHGDQGEWLQCDQCEKKFAYKQILQAHILNNHDKGNFMCDECGVPYNTKSTLRQHKMAVHPSTNGGQSYPCAHPGCGRVFKVAAKLRMHDDVVHKNLEGKYKCTYCPKRFWGKSSLREHTNGVHLNTKPHKCTHCDFSSAYRSK